MMACNRVSVLKTAVMQLHLQVSSFPWQSLHYQGTSAHGRKIELVASRSNDYVWHSSQTYNVAVL